LRLLTTSEAADYLRLKERKLYELVADGAVPCTKVTGKWLFPKDELDRWLSEKLIRPDGLTRAEPMPIVGGSHDPLLEWALRESGSGLAILAEGSEAGIARFQLGELVAVGIHLHALDGADRDENVEAFRIRPGLHDSVLLAFARRDVGLLTATGNPLGIADLKDVKRLRARFATRPQGAGAQLLLRALLHKSEIAAEEVSLISPPCPTGPDVGHMIKSGRADCGIAARTVANSIGLHFVPILTERFDLIVRQRDYFRPAIQVFLGFLKQPAFELRAKELGGYEVQDAGRIRAAP
jgi:excisionase family DNA binding protein